MTKADVRKPDLFSLTPEAEMFYINLTIKGVPYC